MRWRRLLWQLWPWRWARSVAALWRHVRVHPSVVVLGPSGRVASGRGTVIAAGVRVDLGASGRLMMGERVWLAHGVEIETSTCVSIGEGTTIQRRASVNGSVRIGNGCILAPNVFVSSGTHPFRHVPHLPIRQQEALLATSDRAQDGQDRPVWVQGDCWLGVNAVVCPGVTIGKGSIVGANAVVTRDVAPYSVVGGIPARELSRRLEWQPPMQLRADRDEDLPYVLAGRKGSFGGRAALVLTPDDPLRIVLDRSAQRIWIDYASARSETASAAGRQVNIAAGEGRFEVQAQSDERLFQGAILDMKMLSTNAALTGKVYIFRAEGA